MGVNSPLIYFKAVVRRELAGVAARSYMTSAMWNGGGEEMQSYIITIPPLWGRGKGGGASKVIYDLDAMRNKLQSMPCGLGLIYTLYCFILPGCLSSYHWA